MNRYLEDVELVAKKAGYERDSVYKQRKRVASGILVEISMINLSPATATAPRLDQAPDPPTAVSCISTQQCIQSDWILITL